MRAVLMVLTIGMATQLPARDVAEPAQETSKAVVQATSGACPNHARAARFPMPEDARVNLFAPAGSIA